MLNRSSIRKLNQNYLKKPCKNKMHEEPMQNNVPLIVTDFLSPIFQRD